MYLYFKFQHFKLIMRVSRTLMSFMSSFGLQLLDWGLIIGILDSDQWHFWTFELWRFHLITSACHFTIMVLINEVLSFIRSIVWPSKDFSALFCCQAVIIIVPWDLWKSAQLSQYSVKFSQSCWPPILGVVWHMHARAILLCDEPNLPVVSLEYVKDFPVFVVVPVQSSFSWVAACFLTVEVRASSPFP